MARYSNTEPTKKDEKFTIVATSGTQPSPSKQFVAFCRHMCSLGNCNARLQQVNNVRQHKINVSNETQMVLPF
jgi:hypothetical protein